MKRVVLTGAGGFVGRQVAKALLSKGHQVTAILRPGGVSLEDVQGVETNDLFTETVDWWLQHLHGADALIHAAWFVQPGLYLDAKENLDCVRGSLMMAEAARMAGLKHLIGIGTCMEYRLPSESLHVDAPLGPSTLYAASKLALFHMLQQRLAGSQTKLSWARLFYLHGEGEHPARLVPYIQRQLAAGEVAKLSSGIQLRDFLDVAVAGRMIADIVDTGQPGAINICSGKVVTIRQLAERIADQFGRRDLLEFGTARLHPSDPLAVVGICNVKAAEKPGEK